jgi:hypothetical protein
VAYTSVPDRDTLVTYGGSDFAVTAGGGDGLGTGNPMRRQEFITLQNVDLAVQQTPFADIAF